MIVVHRKALLGFVIIAVLAVVGFSLQAPVHAADLQKGYAVYLPSISRPAPPPPPDALSPAQVMLSEINATRASFGLAALTPVQNLDAAADRHSVDMAVNCFTSHTGSDASTPGVRISDAGYTWSTYGEAVGSATVYDIGMMINAWLDSPSHRALLLTTTMRDMGVGYSSGQCSDAASGSVAVWHRWSIDMGVPR